MRRLWIVGLLAWPLFAIPAFAEKLDQTWLGNWIIYADRDDKTGQVTRCFSGASFANDMALGITINQQLNVILLFTNKTWALKEQSAHPLQMSVDGQQPLKLTAYSLTSHSIGALLPDKKTLRDQLTGGKILRLEGDVGTFSFDLNGMDNVLPAVIDCAMKWLKPQDEASVAEAKEDLALTVKLLSMAGISDYKIFTPDEAQRIGLPGYTIWKKGPIMGSLRSIPTAQRDQIDLFFQQIIADNKRGCGNDMIVERHQGDEKTPAPLLAEMVTTCGKLNIITSDYIFERPQGGLYTIGFTGPSKQPDAETLLVTTSQVLSAAAHIGSAQ